MIIGLHDAEKLHMPNKSFPNLALMKISAWHKSQGDTAEWWIPSLYGRYERIYSSKVFDFTPMDPYLPDDAIMGGSGYLDLPVDNKLPQGIDDALPDYSIYPDCDYAIGYLTRGCPRNCEWCIVPKKEGGIRPYRHWEDIARSDSKKIMLMDNNILACSYGIAELESMAGDKGNYKFDFNQGIDARLVDPQVAKTLAGIKWMRFIRFSCDTDAQVYEILRVAELLAGHGVLPYRMFVYLLVRKDVDEAAKRVGRLKVLNGIHLYAQPERNARQEVYPDSLQIEFATRYVYGKCYKKESWEEYTDRHRNGRRKWARELREKAILIGGT